MLWPGLCCVLCCGPADVTDAKQEQPCCVHIGYTVTHVCWRAACVSCGLQVLLMLSWIGPVRTPSPSVCSGTTGTAAQQAQPSTQHPGLHQRCVCRGPQLAAAWVPAVCCDWVQATARDEPGSTGVPVACSRAAATAGQHVKNATMLCSGTRGADESH